MSSTVSTTTRFPKATTIVSCIALAWLCVIPPVVHGQELLWVNRGQELFYGSALSVASDGDVVVACGVISDADVPSWFVRGIDAKTGSTLWEDWLHFGVFDDANEIRVAEGRAFVTGWVFEVGVGYRFVVRAYALRTGELLWGQSITRGAGRDVAKTLALAGGRVYVAGHLRSQTTGSDFALLAFDAASGAPLWESVANPSGVQQNDYAWSVAATGDRVFVAGEVRDFASVLVRALDARSGAILWEDEVQGLRMFAEERSLAVADDTVILAGALVGEARFDYAVIGYNATTGRRLWTDVPPPDGLSEAVAVATSGGRVFVVGLTGCDPTTGGSCELVVRAYEALTGALAWEDLVAIPGGDWNPPSAIAAHGNLVFVGAQSIDATGNLEGRLRAYHANTGALAWVDGFDGSNPGSDDVSRVHVVANRLYVAGQLSRPDGGTDFLVRAYSAR
jgi:outer membrane protein assembly factor BamB